MPRVHLAAVPLLAVLLPLTASALGLGEISLRSALNEPFVAEIPVTSDSGEDFGQLSVQLAPVETFERYGLDRPRFLENFSFQISRDGSRTVVRITSAQPVSEPFVSMLLDVSWPQGRLLREYTVLLDPPTFARPDGTGQQSSQAVVAPAAAAGPAPAAPAIRRESPTRPAPAASASEPSGATGSVSAGPDGDSYGPVRPNETLWRISERLSADRSVSINQMMVALYRANPEAFAGNINRLRRGAILRVPRGNELDGIGSSEATAEVKRQNQEWRGSAGTAPTPARLQLVPPAEQDGGGDGSGPPPAAAGTAVSESSQALEQELAEKERLLSLKDGQLKALQDRVSQLEGRAAPVPGDVPPAAPEGDVLPPVASEGQPADPVKADASAAEDRKPARRPATAKPAAGGGILETLGGLIFNVWFLVSAAVVLLVGLFFVFGRRRMVAAGEASSRLDRDFSSGPVAGAATATPVGRRDGYSVEEVASGRSAPSAASRAKPDGDAETPLERTISTEGALELDQADVVAEANFHLAYGLYDQAAELLLRALRATPDRRDLRLKLIEVYFVWENKAAFLKEAQAFHKQLKGAADPDWNKVVILGKQMCPGEALFSGAVASTDGAGLDLDLAEDTDKGGVDFALDEGYEESPAGAVSRKDATGNLLDFDLGSLEDEGADEDGTTRKGQSNLGAMHSTAEMPTIEAPKAGSDSPTMETPTVEFRGPGERTLETPTLESAVPGPAGRSADSRRTASTDQTEEINLEDLGLDLAGLDEVADDLGTGIHGALVGEDDASGTYSAPDSDDNAFDLSDDDDEADLLKGLEGDATAEMRGMVSDDGTLDLPAFGNAMEKSAASKGSVRDPAAETAAHRSLEDTAEQPRGDGPGLGDLSGELSQVDFDIGDESSADADDELEPTSLMTGRRRGPEGPTMTEVGTKLDLARAYVDMGDPDGARSILNEVLEEGDSAQRQEARRLLDDLSD